METEKIYDEKTQKLIDESSAVLSDYSENLTKRLTAKVENRDITHKQAVDAFLGDPMRNMLLNSCVDIIATSIPVKTIAREV